MMALAAGAGGFFGAILAIILAWIFAGPFCCDHRDDATLEQRPAAATAVQPTERETVAVKAGISLS
jgi:hypothetical protein